MKTAPILSAGLVALAAGCAGDEPCVPAAGTICTVAGSGESGYSGDGGPALEARMSLPIEVLAVPGGDLLILDWNNHRLRKLAADGTMRHVAGRGELGGTLDDPAKSDFNHPTGMVLHPDGRTLFIAAWHNSMIRSVDLETLAIFDECGDGRRAYFGDGALALEASLDLPTSVALDDQNRLLIMDQANQVIRRVNEDGIVERIAGMCVTQRPGGCDPQAELLQCPGGSGKLSCGDLTACDAPCAFGYGGDGGPALEMRMSQPFGVTGQDSLPGGRMLHDSRGNLLFADPANHIIRMIDTDGIVHRIAGTPPDADGTLEAGYAGDGGPALEALMRKPIDLALAADGTLYFSDVENHCVRAIDPGGTVRTVAGVCESRGYAGDGGQATEALLNFPYGIDLAGDNLYIADMGNNVIRQVVVP
jgi:adhesin/invasin